MKISAIVPVYNTEKYISRCIDSVLAQTYIDWELILIDDGSEDRTPIIIDEYKRRDARIIVVHQENAGPGIARNKGLEYASGDYIVFIDSDDTINKDYFSKLSNENSDVVFVDVNQVDEDFKILREEHLSQYENLSKEDLIRNQMTSKIPWGGVRKAVKTSFLKSNNIKYTEHKIGEEAVYSFLLLFYAESFSFIKGAVYNYVNRNGSQSDRVDDDPWGNVALALRNKIVDIGVYEKYADTINSFICTAALVSLQRIALYYTGEEYTEKANERFDRYHEDLDKEYTIDFKHMPVKAKLLYPLLLVRGLRALHHISSIYILIKNR